MTRQYSLPLPHREAMGVDDFMVTSSNADAIGWIDRWPEWPSHCLILYGPEGCGKTHLAHVWQTRSHGKSLTRENLATEDAGMLTMSNRILVLDGADKIAGHRREEECLFHIYNILNETKGFLLLTASQPALQWHIDLADLRSRLLSVPTVAIAPPDDALLSALLIKQFRDRQIDIGMDVIDYLMPRIPRSPAAVRDIVTSLDSLSLAEGRAITIALARRLLEDERFQAS